MKGEIKRSTFGPFGVAVRTPVLGKYFVAWARYGNTAADAPIMERGDVWFQMDETEEGAMQKLHAELKGMLQ